MSYDTISDVLTEIKGAVTKRKRKHKGVHFNDADLIGRHFGFREVLGVTRDARGRTVCLCRCKCKRCDTVSLSRLLAGKSTQCQKCNILNNFKDLTGQTFGRLLVTRRAPNAKDGSACWVCACDCKREPNREIVVRGSYLRSGKTQSCGCLWKESITTHGMTDTPTFASWKAMKERCTNPKKEGYYSRNITVCDRWLNGDGEKSGFECFLQDMGERPPGTTLDRVNNDLEYLPGNCRWATPEEQSNNRRNTRLLTLQNRTQPISRWEREAGLNHGVIRRRLADGWPIDQLLSPLAPRPREITWLDRTQSLTEWARERGLTYNTIKARLDRGWSIEKTLSTPAQQQGSRS